MQDKKTEELRSGNAKQIREFRPDQQHLQMVYGPPNMPGPSQGFMLPPKGTPWTCTCGAANDWNFCTECGAGRPPV